MGDKVVVVLLTAHERIRQIVEARTSGCVLASGATVARAFTYARRAVKGEEEVRRFALDLDIQLEVRLDDGSEEFDREYRERFPERA